MLAQGGKPQVAECTAGCSAASSANDGSTGFGTSAAQQQYVAHNNKAHGDDHQVEGRGGSVSGSRKAIGALHIFACDSGITVEGGLSLGCLVKFQ